MLKVSNISKTIKKKTILDSISLQLNKNEIVGILGPNGAGKTTLLNIIMGFVKEDTGEIMINDEKITHLPVYKRARKGLSYLTQDSSVINELSVKDNIKGVLQLLNIDKTKHEAIISSHLEEFTLTGQINQKAHTLSGGERRKLEIILSLLTDPHFILFDEPFAGLDPITIKELNDLIHILKKKHLGILIVDHNYTEVMNKADRIILIHQGKHFFEGPPAQFIQNPTVKQHYLGLH